MRMASRGLHLCNHDRLRRCRRFFLTALFSVPVVIVMYDPAPAASAELSPYNPPYVQEQVRPNPVELCNTYYDRALRQMTDVRARQNLKQEFETQAAHAVAQGNNDAAAYYYCLASRLSGH